MCPTQTLPSLCRATPLRCTWIHRFFFLPRRGARFANSYTRNCGKRRVKSRDSDEFSGLARNAVWRFTCISVNPALRESTARDR